MTQGMATWVHSGLTGSDAGRNSQHALVTDTAGSSVDENLCLLSSRSRSRSLPTTARSQKDYLQSIRALAHTYSTAERQQSRGGNVAPVDIDPGGCMTRHRSTTMIDTHHRDKRGRMDSELTNDSDREFDMSPGAPLRSNDSGDVFAMPASDDEKAKIISRRLQELDSAQRSWKKRVADYVHGLPTDKVPPAEGGRVQDPKRRRLWSAGCERLPWEINSADGVVPRQRMATFSSDSTFSCSQLSSSSSRDSIQYWVDSIDGLDNPDATLTAAGTALGDGQKRSPGQHMGRKISDGNGVLPKVRSQSPDDDLGLGADAESVTDSTQGEDVVKTKQVIGPRDKMLKRRLTNSEIISLAGQTKTLQSRRKQLQRMGSSNVSDNSVASVSDLLFARNDPEELLLSLGFGGHKEPDPLERIPSRFMQRPSIARGISVQNFLMLSETQDQKLGFSLHGGLRGLRAVLHKSNGTMGASSELYGPAVGESCLGGDIVSGVVTEETRNLSNEPVGMFDAVTSKEWLDDRVKKIHRSDRSELNSKPNFLTNDTFRFKNSFNNSSDSSHVTKDISEHPSCESVNSTSKSELFSRSMSNVSSVDSVTSSGSEFYISDSSDSDWDYEEGDPGLGSSRSSEDHRRSRIARMVMPEPLLPPVHEELEVTPTPQSRKAHQIPTKSNPNQELKTIETSKSKETIESPDSFSLKREVDLTPAERKVASLTPDTTPHRLTHNQESFEIEEISSTENQEDGSPVNKVADKTTEKGPLVRTDSTQSDSSGFADEVMESTVIINSPCSEDCNGQGSSGRDYNNDNMAEVGNKLIQTSFDDFGVLESFDRDDWAEENSDALSGRTVVTVEDERISNPSSLSSTDRIARSRKSFRESRSSYDRMGSTFSGMSVTSMEDSPFDDTILPKYTPVPRQRSETYPTVADKQETPSGPKTIVEILTTLQENIKQASEAKNFMEDQESGKPNKKRPALVKMKTVEYDSFSVDGIPSLMESVEAIIGRTKQTQKSTLNSADQDMETPDRIEAKLPSAEKAEVVDDAVKLSPNLMKRKSSQILRVPTLPCLDEENTPVNSRHSSVSDLLPRLSTNPSVGYRMVSGFVAKTDTAPCTNEDVESENFDCADLRSDTEAAESMVANADSIGDLGDLEEEMRYLEHVESLLQREGKLLDEATLTQSHLRTSNEEPRPLHPEDTIVPVSESTCQSCLLIVRPFHSAIQPGTATQTFSSELDKPFPLNHSGDYLNVSNADSISDVHKVASQVIPNASSSLDLTSPKPAELVESSMCLYLSPTPFVIDVSQMIRCDGISEDGDLGTELLCKTPDAEIMPKRYRTSVELALEGKPSDEKCVKRSVTSTESITRGKSEDKFHDVKLIQNALFKYKNDLLELESLSERVHSRRHNDNDDDDDNNEGGGMERNRMELDSVRGLRRQIMDELEIMEGQLATRTRRAIAKNNFPSEFEDSLASSTDANLQIIQEMVNLLDEQRSLRRMLNDLETTQPETSPSEASTQPDPSAVGSGEWMVSGEEEEGVRDQGGDDKREMMEALMSVRLELQQQREMTRREMNSAVREAKDKEIEELKELLRDQMLQDRE